MPTQLGQPGSGVLTLSWEDPSGGSASLPDQATIFALRLRALGLGGTSSQVIINGEPTLVEVLDGQLAPLALALLPGTVTIGGGGTAVELELITLQGKQYQLETSVDLDTWTSYEGVFTGTGGKTSKLISIKDKQLTYWRLKMMP